MVDNSTPEPPSEGASVALSDKDWNALVLALERKISDEAPEWTTDFYGQPGTVVGVMDAAIVAARYCAERGLGCSPDCTDDTHGHPLPEDRTQPSEETPPAPNDHSPSGGDP